MLTNEAVLKCFEEYLQKDPDCEVVLTRHGYAVLLWNEPRQEWWEIFSCPTPEALFDKLLEAATQFHTCRLLQKSGADDLTEQEEAEVKQTRQYFRNLRTKV